MKTARTLVLAVLLATLAAAPTRATTPTATLQTYLRQADATGWTTTGPGALGVTTRSDGPHMTARGEDATFLATSPPLAATPGSVVTVTFSMVTTTNPPSHPLQLRDTAGTLLVDSRAFDGRLDLSDGAGWTRVKDDLGTAPVRLDIRMLGDGRYAVRVDGGAERTRASLADGVPARLTIRPNATTVVMRSVRVTSSPDYPDETFTTDHLTAPWRAHETLSGGHIRHRDDMGATTPGAIEIGTNLAPAGAGVGTIGFDRDLLGMRYLLHASFRAAGLACVPDGSAIFAGLAANGAVRWAIEAESVNSQSALCAWRPVYRDASGARAVLGDGRTFTFSPWHTVEVEADETTDELRVLVDKAVLGVATGVTFADVEQIAIGKVDLVEPYHRGGHWDDVFAITS